ncbi:MAG TPA: PLD nuclease N-terminal domain-containing protein [Ilumatobacteraceae bacterium]
MATESPDRSRKKQWNELSPTAQRAIVVGGVLEAIVTTIALRDLRRRPRGTVRGPKLLWLLGLFVQPIGAPLYLAVGRRGR